MNAPASHRGKHLTRRRAGLDGGLLSRLFAPAFQRVLDRIDRGLAEGMIEGRLPDGSIRMIGGHAPGPRVEVLLVDWSALVRLVIGGSAGWYRAWERGEWTSPDPVPLFDLFMRNRKSLGMSARAVGPWRALARLRHTMRANSKTNARRNIAYHYDLGNDFYALWLDETMSYSSAVFADPGDRAESLESAQRRKNALLLDRLDLAEGDRLLEIGCGWGGLAEAAMERGALDYHGITLSQEQRLYCIDRLAGQDAARFTLTDYRDVAAQEGEGGYDAIASVEMVEAVGQRYWPAYLDAVAANLKPGGRAAIQYIRIADEIFERYATSADFIQTYIFPGGMLLSESRFRALAEARGLKWREQSDYGPHYAETLRRWRQRFDSAVDEDRLPAGFDPHFVRLWRYYLMYCEGGFRGGGIDVAQVTLVKE